ncbi:MAG: HyaD/HybD family hydrogenase maturation endopeptidase [Pseudomonadota bacterium]
MEKTVSLIGMGNILMKDEGVGVHALNAFSNRYSVPDNVDVVDAGTIGLELIPYIERRDKVLMVDCVQFEKEPGYIGVIMDENIPARLSVKASIHHLGLMDVLSLIKLRDTMPKTLCLIGVQPKAVELGLEMTSDILARMDDVVKLIVDKLRAWDIACIDHGTQTI